jgi:hypothetical protein
MGSRWCKIATTTVFTIVLLLPSIALFAAVNGHGRGGGLLLKLILLPFIFMYVLYRNRQLRRRKE